MRMKKRRGKDRQSRYPEKYSQVPQIYCSNELADGERHHRFLQEDRDPTNRGQRPDDAAHAHASIALMQIHAFNCKSPSDLLLCAICKFACVMGGCSLIMWETRGGYGFPKRGGSD